MSTRFAESDVGNYAYPAPASPSPHAVSSISGSVVNTACTYDANGNMTAGNGLAISYIARPLNNPLAQRKLPQKEYPTQ